MKKILITIIVGILIIGIATASILSVANSDFKTKINTVSSSLFYSKLVEENKMDSKDIPIDTTLDLTNSNIEITQNKEGVYRVRSK